MSRVSVACVPRIPTYSNAEENTRPPLSVLLRTDPESIPKRGGLRIVGSTIQVVSPLALTLIQSRYSLSMRQTAPMGTHNHSRARQVWPLLA